MDMDRYGWIWMDMDGRKSIENLSNIYRKSIENLSKIYRTSIEHLSKIYVSEVYLRCIWGVSGVYPKISTGAQIG